MGCNKNINFLCNVKFVQSYSFKGFLEYRKTAVWSFNTAFKVYLAMLFYLFFVNITHHRRLENFKNAGQKHPKTISGLLKNIFSAFIVRNDTFLCEN